MKIYFDSTSEFNSVVDFIIGGALVLLLEYFILDAWFPNVPL